MPPHTHTRRLAVNPVEQHKFSLLTLDNLRRVNAESRRLVFVQVKVQTRFHEHFTALMLKTQKVPFSRLQLP